MLKEALSLKLQQGIKDYIMDFKDILTQFDKVTEKEDNNVDVLTIMLSVIFWP